MPIREQISYKQHEDYIRSIRDDLCAHYRLNKSDLVKYLIRKEEVHINDCARPIPIPGGH